MTSVCYEVTYHSCLTESVNGVMVIGNKQKFLKKGGGGPYP